MLHIYLKKILIEEKHQKNIINFNKNNYYEEYIYTIIINLHDFTIM